MQTLDWSLGTERVAGENDFTTGYGTVLDSGTTFTYVTTPVFENFVAVLDAAVVAPGALKRVDGPDPSYPDDVCYAADAAAPPLTEASLADAFPNLTLRFAGDDVTLALPPKNYLFAHGGVAGAFCLGVMDNGRAADAARGSPRDVLVEYDLTGEGRVGMAVTDCAHVLDSLSARATPPRTPPPRTRRRDRRRRRRSDAARARTRPPPPPAAAAAPGSPSAASDSVAPSGTSRWCFWWARGSRWSITGAGRGGWTRTATVARGARRSHGGGGFPRERDFPGQVGRAQADRGAARGYARFGLDGERPRGRHGGSSRRSSPGGEPEPKVT